MSQKHSEDNVDLSPTLLAQIRGRMSELNLSQTHIARYLGIGQSTFNNKLHGASHFSMAHIKKLSSILEMKELREYIQQETTRETHQNDFKRALMIIEEASLHLSPRDLRELIFGMCLLIEGKSRQKNKRFMQLLRALARLKVDEHPPVLNDTP